jgi:hypothetical protein
MKAKTRRQPTDREKVRDARALCSDFDNVIYWARRDQQECFQIVPPEDRHDIEENIRMIDRVEKKIRDILAQRAR